MPRWVDTMRQAVLARPGWSAAAFACALAVLAVLPVDGPVQSSVHAWAKLPGLSAILDLMRPFGRGEVAVLVALAVAASGRRRLGAQLILALIICAVITWMLKIGIGRMRPNEAAFSFVSGDASTAFALVPLLARSWAAGLGCLAIAAGVALSRVVYGYHWPSDVLGGAAVGLFSAVLAVRLWPLRPWTWLTSRRTWVWLAALAWVGAIGWAATSSRVPWLRTFLGVFGPALVLWSLWPWLRLRLRLGWRPQPWLIAVILVAALTALSCATTLWDRDEPRNALAAREMLAQGDWLVPTFNGEPRLHKPILPYWLMTLALRLPLPPDLACRLPAVLCMGLAVLILGATMRRLLPDRPQAAVVAVLVLACSPLVLVSGSAATTDAALLLGIAATMWVLVRCLLDGPRFWQVPAAGLAIGWALLAKGPMGLFVPLATIAVLGGCAWTNAGRGLVTWRTWLVLFGAIACGSALALAWFVPADRSLDGAMWGTMIGEHVWKRGLEARESHGGPFFYYLPVLLVGCLAWLPALVAALRRPWAGDESHARLILLAWALPILVVLSVFQTKLPHYLLPMLWPMAGLLVLAIHAPPGDEAWWRWGRRVQVALLALVVAALILGPPGAALGQDAGLLRLPISLSALIAPALAAGLAFWLLACLTGQRRAFFAVGAGVGMLALALALSANAGRLEIYKPAPRIAAEINARVPAGVPIGTCGFDEPSLYFYLGPERGPIQRVGGGKTLRTWSTQEGAAVLVVTAKALAEAGADLPVAELARFPGYNYSNGKAVEVVLLGRNLPSRSRVRRLDP